MLIDKLGQPIAHLVCPLVLGFFVDETLFDTSAPYFKRIESGLAKRPWDEWVLSSSYSENLLVQKRV